METVFQVQKQINLLEQESIKVSINNLFSFPFIKKAIDELKEILNDDSASSENIKSKLDALNTAAMKLGEIMYKQNQQDPGQEGPKETAGENKGENKADNTSKEEDIVDADFEEVKEDKEKKSNQCSTGTLRK